MTHRLDPLLRPRSIAIVGASARSATVGNHTLSNILAGGFAGQLYPINPNYDELLGKTCYPSFAALKATPDLAIFCISDTRIEAALDDAIAAGVKAVSIMSSLVVDNDTVPALKERIREKIRAAGLVACGANGMGFYNTDHALWACGFDGRRHDAPGRASLISHSGSGMCGIVDCERRIRFKLAVSTGNELGATMDEYLDFALDMPDTRVVGLFVETARNPHGLRRAFEKANRKRIPIVAVKVGKTKKSAELTVSHSGSIAGDDATYNALFDRYGVHRARDLDELATALILFSQWPVPGDGGLVALHDSGGERQLMIDLADKFAVVMPELSDKTVAALEKVLDPELPAVNPLDGWSRGGHDYHTQMTDCLSLLMQDRSAAIGVLMHDRAPDGRIYQEYIDYMKRACEESGKPVALLATRQGTGSDPLVEQATHEGFPIVDDVSNFLSCVRAVFGWRDFLNRQDDPATAPEQDLVSRWKLRLGQSEPMSEADCLRLLDEFGVKAIKSIAANSSSAAVAAADAIGYPVVLKTAAAGIAHKSDVGGVVLGLRNGKDVITQYKRMSRRLGAGVVISAMLQTGVEMILGMKTDPQFGPVIVLGMGGIYSEVLHDVEFAIPPFGAAKARELLDRLRMRALLDGARSQPAVAIDAFCEMAANFSAMVYVLKDNIREFDVNPVIVGVESATAVDALLVRNVLIEGLQK